MKTVLVTGANRGIGREVARELAKKGFQVFVGARNAKAGRKAADDIGAKFLEIDVANNDSVIAAARELAKQIDALDVLVNNAGIVVDGDDNVLKDTHEMFRETFETNTLGPLRVTRAFVPFREKSAATRGTNVTSRGRERHGAAEGSGP